MAKFEIRSIDTSGGIDGQSVLRSCAESAKSWVRDTRRPGKCTNRLEATGLLAKYASGVARAVLGRTMDLEQRVAALEQVKVTKALDAETYETMGDLAERLESMESRVTATEERCWRYRGYWRDGMSAERNDAFTHNGSLFLAMCRTQEAPDGGSVDWNVIARKGRDGKDAR